MVEFGCFYHVILLSLLNHLGNRLRPQVEHFVSPVFLHHFTHVQVFEGLLGDGLSQVLLKVLVVYNATDPLGFRVVSSTGFTKSEFRVLGDVLWHHWLVVS